MPFKPLITRISVALLIAASSVAGASPDEVLIAGGDEVFIIDVAKADRGGTEKVWSWSIGDAPGLSDEEKRGFNHFDECKPVDGGAKILVCASNGGCALIERATKHLVWHTHVTNAHSLELLPHNRVVVASSLSGDKLIVFDLSKPTEPLFKTPLHSAHGVVWDEKRQCLWALGHDEVLSFALDQWDSDKPALKLQSKHELPDKDGHDLRAAPKGNALTVSTEHAVYLFDRDTGTFTLHPVLGGLSGIKSVDVHPETGRIVVSNWSAALRLFAPESSLSFKSAHPYKARWIPAAGS